MKFPTPSLFFVIAITFCCSEEDQDTPNTPVEYEAAITPVGTPEGDPITKTIGTGGGSIASPDGIVELVIPAGALPANTDITIQPVTNESPGGIGLAYDLLPDGTTFNKPATLTFHYTDEDVNGSNPLFLYIAYQDVDRTWVSDFKNQSLDTIAKTISLDITHFTIFSEGTDFPRIFASKKVLRPGETSALAMMETFVIQDSKGELHTEGYAVPAEMISNWRIHIGGEGTLNGSGTLVTYHAPNRISSKRTVTISAHVNVAITTFVNGKKITIHGLDPQIELTLEPIPPRKYEISIDHVDSLISPFYGNKTIAIPVYRDQAKFELELKFVNDVVEVTVSPIQNGPPTVTPATKEYAGTTFIWIPDPIGMTNIKQVVMTSVATVTQDPILRFDLRHENATRHGRILETGEHKSTIHPEAFSGHFGRPDFFELDLSRKTPYYDPNYSNPNDPTLRGGLHTFIHIAPKE
jgi:hypothetical protein